MTTGTGKAKAAPSAEASHRMQPPRGTALDIAQFNHAEWFAAHKSAIEAMDALDQMEAPDCATPAERERFRQRRRAAFVAVRDIGFMAGAMVVLNHAHIELKSSSAPVNDAIADVKKEQRERAERRKAGK